MCDCVDVQPHHQPSHARVGGAGVVDMPAGDLQVVDDKAHLPVPLPQHRSMSSTRRGTLHEPSPGNSNLKPRHAAAGMPGTEEHGSLPSLCSRICRSPIARLRRKPQGQMLHGSSDNDIESTHAHLGRSTSTGRPALSVATPPALSRSRNCLPVSASGAISSHVTASGLYSRRLQRMAGTGCPQMAGGCWCSLVDANAMQGRGACIDTSARRI